MQAKSWAPLFFTRANFGARQAYYYGDRLTTSIGQFSWLHDRSSEEINQQAVKSHLYSYQKIPHI